MRTIKSIVERDGGMWRELCPMLDGLSRALSSRTTKYAEPIEAEPVEATAADSALVAFAVFHRWSRQEVEIDRSAVRAVLAEGGAPVRSDSDVEFIFGLSRNMHELSGALGITELPSVRRPLPPCGVVESAHCDATWGPNLVEFKAVRRAFSIRDLRQVLLYGALCWADGDFCPVTAVVANPLAGTLVSMPYSQIASIASGRSFEHLSRDIADHLVGLGISG